MSGPRRKLRTRLLVAMVAIALGTLVLTALVTAGLARDASFDSARSDLKDHGQIIAGELDQLIARLPAAKVASTTAGGRRQIVRIRNLVNTTLEASDGAVIGIDANGDVQEVLGLLLGVDQGEIVTLPNGVAVDDLDTAALQDGTTQEGRAGSTVFTAIPLTPIGGLTPVLVLADEVNTRPFGAAGGAVLGAAILALVIAAAVAAYLARRLTRPIAAMESTARSIAGGDLSARVDEEHVRDDELGSLAHAINGMAQELEESQGHERAFLLSVSHDLRTPLTSIRGYAEAIADGTVESDDARVRAAEVITSESKRLERLVADLLDLARLDTHQFSLRPQPIDARAVVAEAVDAFRPSAAELGISLVTDDGPVVSAEGDPQRLAQVVANLVENALKFAAAEVRVAVQPNATGFEVLVDDDGPGIAPADLPHVFERLYTSRTVPGRTVGTGIGLAIVRELAVAMGGTARVETVDATGTRFVVTLPSQSPVAS
ncbi:MAG TPA: HAMP domain-containing sensor histidine kinase [Acidimicrobiia bacterium]|nr:HAMP domain-containing sensor histidine kinase [Acidimicrobiia bacterium]